MIEGTDMNQIEKVARAFPALWNLVQYHKSGGHSGSGTDRTLANALRELAAIAAMPVQAEPQWQGIESAPRDGTRMILAKFVGHPAHDTALRWAVAGHWSDKWQNWNDGVEPCGLAGPTHWMPLPTPPAGGSDAE